MHTLSSPTHSVREAAGETHLKSLGTPRGHLAGVLRPYYYLYLYRAGYLNYQVTDENTPLPGMDFKRPPFSFLLSRDIVSA